MIPQRSLKRLSLGLISFAEGKMNFWQTKIFHLFYQGRKGRNKDQLHKIMFVLPIELPYLCVNLQ